MEPEPGNAGAGNKKLEESFGSTETLFFGIRSRI